MPGKGRMTDSEQNYFIMKQARKLAGLVFFRQQRPGRLLPGFGPAAGSGQGGLYPLQMIRPESFRVPLRIPPGVRVLCTCRKA